MLLPVSNMMWSKSSSPSRIIGASLMVVVHLIPRLHSNFPISPFSNCIPSGSPPNGFFASLMSKLLTTLGSGLDAKKPLLVLILQVQNSTRNKRSVSDINLPEPDTGKSSSIILSPVERMCLLIVQTLFQFVLSQCEINLV